MSYSILPKNSGMLRHVPLIVFLLLSAGPIGAQTTSDSSPAATAGTAMSSTSVPVTTTAPAVAPGATPPTVPSTTVPDTTMPPTPLGVSVEGLYEHDFSADLKDGASGKMDVNQFELFSIYGHNFTDQDQLIVGADYLFQNNDFRDGPAPFGNVQQVGADGWYTHDFDPNWAGFGYLYGGFSAATGGSLARGGQVAVALGPSYTVNPDLNFSAGPMFYTRLENDDAWTMMGNLQWNFLPQWNLRVYTGIANGATVSYDIFNNHATIVDGSLEYNRFWFSTSDTPAGADQSVEQRYWDWKFGVRQALSNNCYVRGYLSVIFDRKYSFQSDDSSTGSFQVDPTLGIGVEFGVVF